MKLVVMVVVVVVVVVVKVVVVVVLLFRVVMVVVVLVVEVVDKRRATTSIFNSIIKHNPYHQAYKEIILSNHNCRPYKSHDHHPYPTTTFTTQHILNMILLVMVVEVTLVGLL